MPLKSDGQKPWTRQELTVFRNGIAALAGAVIRQWELDGRPDRDSDMIKAWEGILNAAQEK